MSFHASQRVSNASTWPVHEGSIAMNFEKPSLVGSAYASLLVMIGIPLFVLGLVNAAVGDSRMAFILGGSGFGALYLGMTRLAKKEGTGSEKRSFMSYVYGALLVIIGIPLFCWGLLLLARGDFRISFVLGGAGLGALYLGVTSFARHRELGRSAESTAPCRHCGRIISVYTRKCPRCEKENPDYRP